MVKSIFTDGGFQSNYFLNTVCFKCELCMECINKFTVVEIFMVVPYEVAKKDLKAEIFTEQALRGSLLNRFMFQQKIRWRQISEFIWTLRGVAWLSGEARELENLCLQNHIQTKQRGRRRADKEGA